MKGAPEGPGGLRIAGETGVAAAADTGRMVLTLRDSPDQDTELVRVQEGTRREDTQQEGSPAGVVHHNTRLAEGGVEVGDIGLGEAD